MSSFLSIISGFFKSSNLKISYSSRAYGVLKWICYLFSIIHWERIQAFINGGMYYKLTELDHDNLRALLKPNYYFILTRRRCHLTTYLISIASKITTGKFSHYTHALMDIGSGNTLDDSSFRLIEATNIGVHFSTFMQVFDCDSVALLKPKNVLTKDWTLIIDKALADSGKEYDDLFDISSNDRVSCIELCRDALEALPDYSYKFSNFEKMIKENKNNLTPQMLYDCPDFEIVYEVRR